MPEGGTRGLEGLSKEANPRDPGRHATYKARARTLTVVDLAPFDPGVHSFYVLGLAAAASRKADGKPTLDAPWSANDDGRIKGIWTAKIRDRDRPSVLYCSSGLHWTTFLAVDRFQEVPLPLRHLDGTQRKHQLMLLVLAAVCGKSPPRSPVLLLPG